MAMWHNCNCGSSTVEVVPLTIKVAFIESTVMQRYVLLLAQN